MRREFLVFSFTFLEKFTWRYLRALKTHLPAEASAQAGNSELKTSPGFTLIEMIVAIALFAVVMVVAVGALLSLTAANKKAQGLQSVMNNLNISIDSMVRNIRMGNQYDASTDSSAGIVCSSNTGGPNDCNAGSDGVVFSCNPNAPSCASTGPRWAYKFVCGSMSNGSCTSGGYIAKSTDGGSSWNAITSSDSTSLEKLNIKNLTFYVVGSDPDDSIQPKTIIVIQGEAGVGRSKTTFHIQATAVQRELDL